MTCILVVAVEAIQVFELVIDLECGRCYGPLIDCNYGLPLVLEAQFFKLYAEAGDLQINSDQPPLLLYMGKRTRDPRFDRFGSHMRVPLHILASPCFS
jgi:transcriptional antiterminator Rof (Rho-off)